MGMADDDLAYVVANTHTLNDQQSKFYYASGFSAGVELANSAMNQTLNHLKHETKFLFDLLSHEAELGEGYLLGKSFFIRSVRELNNTYDGIGNHITYGGTTSNSFTFDVVENWAWGKYDLVRKLVEYPALYKEVFGCSGNVPSPTLEWVKLKEFRRNEALTEQQVWFVELMKQNKQLSDLANSYAGKVSCLCSTCISCCGNGCSCSYEHLDNDEYQLGCDDPGECDLYEHSVCHACLAECECC
jgi:hypothetical protein